MAAKQTVESIYSAFRRGDIPYIVNQIAPNVSWRQPASLPWGGDYSNPAEVSRFFAKIYEAVETTGFEIEENIEAGDQVISYGYYDFRNRAPGNTSRARFVFRWQVKDGKVTGYEGVLDSAPVAAAAAAETSSAMTPQRIVEAMYSAYRRGDVSSIVDQMAPDVMWRQPTSVPWGRFQGTGGGPPFFFCQPRCGCRNHCF